MTRILADGRRVTAGTLGQGGPAGVFREGDTTSRQTASTPRPIDGLRRRRGPSLLDEAIAPPEQRDVDGDYRPDERLDERRLAGTVRAEQAEELAGLDRERQSVERPDVA